jgi:hypothetical protein
MLLPFPQYKGVSDVYGDVANSNYNAWQVRLQQRMSHGLQFTLNYTYSHEIDDQGTYRSGYLPTRVDRSRGTGDTPELLSVTSVYNLPFGEGHALGSRNFVVRSLVSGWQAAGVFSYSSGAPLTIGGSCTTPNGGTCEPNYVPGFSGPVRVNGSWGAGALAGITSPKYLIGGTKTDPTNPAFADPPAYTIGNLARTAPYGLRGPSTYDIDMSVKRTFPIYENVKLVFDVEAFNVTNKVLFAINSTSIDSSAFGQVTTGSVANTSRDIQLAARINF